MSNGKAVIVFRGVPEVYQLVNPEESSGHNARMLEEARSQAVSCAMNGEEPWTYLVVTADELDRAVTMAPEKVTAHKTTDWIREAENR